MTKILLTTTSFQDTPGEHHEMLRAAGFDVVTERGPLSEAKMIELAGEFEEEEIRLVRIKVLAEGN